MDSMRIHINCPYSMLIREWERFIRLNMSPEVYFTGGDLDTVDTDFLYRLRMFVKESGLTLSLHAPYMDLSPGAIDERIRAVTEERFKQVIDVAGILKPETVVFHPGFDRWRYNGHEDLWLKQSLKTWKPMVRRAEDLGFIVAVENVFEEDPSTLISLVESIDSEHFRLCFDIGHFTVFSRVSMEEWYKAVSPYLVELHLHDNHGRTDEHIAIGDGIIDFRNLFSLLGSHSSRKLVYTFEPHRERDLTKGLKRLKILLKEIES